MMSLLFSVGVVSEEEKADSGFVGKGRKINVQFAGKLLLLV